MLQDHQELRTAVQAVASASVICRAVQASITTESLEKKDRSPVTVADYASQAVICRALREAFPNDPIVAEEDAASLREPGNEPFHERILKEIQATGLSANLDNVLNWIDEGNHDGTARRFWTLDPIDGTKGFLRSDQYAVSLALIVDGQIQVAALACPNLPVGSDAQGKGVVFYALRGQGAYGVPLDQLDAEPVAVRVSTRKEISQARVCESFESGHSAHGQSAEIIERLGITAAPVRMDSQAKYAAVARGDAEIYLRLPTRADYQEKIWDHAGGVLVVEEAEGTVTDVDGQPLDFSVGATLRNNRGVVVTNGALHQEIVAAVGAVLSPA